MNIQGWCPLGLICLLSLQFKALLKSLLQHQSLKAPILSLQGQIILGTPCEGFSGGSEVKNPPGMQETHILFLGQEDLLEKTVESPLDCKDIKPVNPKRNQPWTVIGRTGAEDEAPMLWPPDAKSQFIGKDPGAGKDWGQEEKGVIEDEMVGWHHWLNRHEFEQMLGDSEGQGSLAGYSPSGHKDLDTT